MVYTTVVEENECGQTFEFSSGGFVSRRHYSHDTKMKGIPLSTSIRGQHYPHDTKRKKWKMNSKRNGHEARCGSRKNQLRQLVPTRLNGQRHYPGWIQLRHNKSRRRDGVKNPYKGHKSMSLTCVFSGIENIKIIKSITVICIMCSVLLRVVSNTQR